MTMNGGFIQIDCTGLDLLKGTTPQTVEGLYQRVKVATGIGKPIMAYNAIWGPGRAVTPILVFAIDWGDFIICTASTLQVVINPDDSVIINNMAPEG